MSEWQAAVAAMRGGETVGRAGCAIVLGAKGRVGAAFVRRLHDDGFLVLADPEDPAAIARAAAPVWLFDCAYQDGDAVGHVVRVAGHLADWRAYAAIFVPSSSWIDADSDYGRAKRAVEALVALYAGIGAAVVTDRIGYFPGDGAVADPTEPMIAGLVDGDTLYARVMASLRAVSAITANTSAASSGRQISRSGSSGLAQL